MTTEGPSPPQLLIAGKLLALRQLKLDLNSSRKTADFPKRSELPEAVSQLVADYTLIPPFVATPNGMHAFSTEERASLAGEIITMDPQNDAFLTRADKIVENALFLAEVKEGEEKRDFERLRGQKEHAGKKVAKNEIDHLEREAQTLARSDPFEKFGDALVTALSQNSRYEVIGTYLLHTRATARELQELLSDISDTEIPNQATFDQIYLLTKRLLRSSEPLSNGKQFKSSKLLPQTADDLDVLSSELKRIPQNRAKKWQGAKGLKTLLEKSIDVILSPEKAISCMYQAEMKGFLGDEKAISSQRGEELVQITDTIDQIKEIFYLSRIDQSIESMTDLPSGQREYLRLAAYEKAAAYGKTTASFAYEAAQENEIVLQNVKSMIENLQAEGFLPSPQAAPRDKIFHPIQSALRIALITTILAAQIPADFYPPVASQIASIVESGQKFSEQLVSVSDQLIHEVHELVIPPPLIHPLEPIPIPTEIIVQPEVPSEAQTQSTAESNPTIQQQPSPTPPSPSISESADSKQQQSLPDRHYDEPSLDEKNSSWKNNESVNSSVHSPEAGITPEQYARQASIVMWEVLLDQNSDNYFINRFSGFYSPTENIFFSTAVTPPFEFHQVPAEAAETITRLYAKREFFDQNTMTIPSQWNTHISEAKVTFKDEKTGVTTNIPVAVGTSPYGEKFLQLDYELYKKLIDTSGRGGQTGDQTIEITVGFAQGSDSPLSPEFAFADHDAQFPDITVLPQDLQELITTLNKDTKKDDLDKLQEVRQWFLDHFTYSFDPTYNNYYSRGNPTPEQYLRRVFGTGNTTDDPNYLDDPRYTERGICESVNTDTAIASRFLDLKDGQVVMVDGFIHQGFFSSTGNDAITGGQLHAWMGYISKKGEYTLFDSTPTKIDTYTSEVFSKTARNISRPGQNQGFRAEVSIPPLLERIEADTGDTPLHSFHETVPIPQRIQEALSTHENSLNTWRLIPKNTPNGGPFSSYSDHLGVDLSFRFDTENNKWHSSVDHNYLRQNLSTGNGFDHEQSLTHTAKGFDKSYTASDLAFDLIGIVKLDGNAVMLPTMGDMSPKTLTVNEIVTKPDGTVEKVPLEIDRIEYSPNLFDKYMLVLKYNSEKIKGAIVEIKYKTVMKDSLFSVEKSDLEYTFQPIIPMSWLDPAYQSLITTLDQAKSLDDLTKNDYVQYGLTPDKAKYLIEKIQEDIEYPRDKNIQSATIDRIKVYILKNYIDTNYTLTWNPEWSRFYNGNHADASTYWQRVARYKRIDPETASTLLIAGARLILSQQGEYNIPMVLEISYRDFSSSGPMRFLGTYFNYYPDKVWHFTSAEKGLNPVLLYKTYPPSRFDPSQNTYVPTEPSPYIEYFMNGLGFGFMDSFDMKLDRVSQGQAATTLENLYTPELLSQETETAQQFVADKLPEKQELYDALEDAFNLRFLEWIHDEPWAAEVGGILLLDTLLIMYERSKTRWWKKYDPEIFKEILDETATEMGISSDHSVYKHMSLFYENVLKPSQGAVKPPLLKALRMEKFNLEHGRWLNRKNRDIHNDPRLFTKKRIFNPKRDETAIPREKRWFDTRQHRRIRNIAIGELGGYDDFTVELSRRLMHHVYRETFLPEALLGNSSNQTGLYELSYRFYDYAITIPGFDYPTGIIDFRYNQIQKIFSGFPREIQQLSLSNPERFLTEATNQLHDKLLEFLKSSTLQNKLFMTDENRQSINHMSSEIAQTLLPFYALIMEEKRHVTELQRDRARMKRDYKKKKKKKKQ